MRRFKATVGRKGIQVENRWYTDVEMIARALGRKVEVLILEKEIFVSDEGELLTHFDKRVRCKERAEKKEVRYPTPEYYEHMIRCRPDCRPRSCVDILIQKLAKKDPAYVLAVIGVTHPAAEVVLKYLADQILTDPEPERKHPVCEGCILEHSHTGNPL